MSNAKITGGDSIMHECEVELRRGPWTLEEDNLLIQYISCHGEGRWNSLAKFAGLKRTGKSCRLRWLNYLKPDIKRGDLSPHEQLLILELHSKWGNRWSKIAQHLPGRTDNEIKNYWRTRVQKQARQLKVDSNSNKFLDAIRTFWMPRLLEQINQNPPSSPPSSSSSSTLETHSCLPPSSSSSCHVPALDDLMNPVINNSNSEGNYNFLEQVPISTDSKNQMDIPVKESYCSPTCFDSIPLPECHAADMDWFGDDLDADFWNSCDELWQFRK